MSTFTKLWSLREALRRLFLRESKAPEDAVALLDDLRAFCRADAPTLQFDREGRVDPIASAMIEGRREVYLRIQAKLNMTDEQLNLLAKRDETESTT